VCMFLREGNGLFDETEAIAISLFTPCCRGAVSSCFTAISLDVHFSAIITRCYYSLFIKHVPSSYFLLGFKPTHSSCVLLLYLS
jgi:hypothetical protein